MECLSVYTGLRHIRFEGGRTHSASALQMVRNQIFSSTNGDRQNVPDIAIIFTDGKCDL